MNISFWINNKRHKNIYCRLSKQHQRKEISTGLHINPKQWGGSYLLAKGTSPEARLINQRLQLIKFKLENIIFELEKKGDHTITPLLVKNIYEGKDATTCTQATPLQNTLHEAFSIISETITPNSIISYQSAVIDFKAFLALQNLSGINTHAIDTSITEGYLVSLRDRNNKFATIKIKFTRLATLFDVILNDFQCLKPDSNPFKKLKIKKTPSEAKTTENKDKWIDKDVQTLIENAKLDNILDYYRNMFLFQLNTGLAWVDMMNFDPDLHIIVDIDKFKWIRLRRIKTIKTNRYSEIPLSEETKRLIKYFKGHQTNGSLINEFSYVHYLYKLKKIAKTIEIPPLTSHMARHTFGVRMLESGLSMESVSHMMGHASITMTESIYAKVTKRKLKLDLEKARITG
ncbi:MAG: tyrosine-type recombinase/integrase [Cyclobacteriaceae bacterium]|nr:tyrosine-type recombinase/integrase [Cyclobacteriaceae bacterium]